MENTETLRFCKLRNVKSPNRAHQYDAGIDWYVPEDLTMLEMQSSNNITGSNPSFIENEETGFIQTIVLRPGDSVLIPTGIKVNVPHGYALIYDNKSGVASKRSLLVGSSVVDIGYQGICHINLHNVSNTTQKINAGDKIVQSIMYKIGFHTPEEVSEAELYTEQSARGQGGFGSSGTK